METKVERLAALFGNLWKVIFANLRLEISVTI